MANPANPATAAIHRFLARSARHGPPLLAAGIFGGVAFPGLAHPGRAVLTPDVLAMVTVVLMRVDVRRAIGFLRRPLLAAAMTAFLLLACPVLAWLAVLPLPLGPGLADGVVIFATGCAATSSPAFARLVKLDPELSLVVTLATTFLVPLTAPLATLVLLGTGLHVGVGAFMARLALVVGLPAVLAAALRFLLGRDRVVVWGDALDGLLVLLLVVYGVGAMDGLGPQLTREPGWVAQALAAAFLSNYGLNVLTAAAFWPFAGRTAALSAGLMSGNRNMALYLAVLPAAADPRISLFFGICQFPLFFSPFLLRPVYRLLMRPERPPA